MWTKLAGRGIPTILRTNGTQMSGLTGNLRHRMTRSFAFSSFQKKKSLYEILEIDTSADAKTIKKAFMKKGSLLVTQLRYIILMWLGINLTKRSSRISSLLMRPC
jgi:hypothetical protein